MLGQGFGQAGLAAADRPGDRHIGFGIPQVVAQPGHGPTDAGMNQVGSDFGRRLNHEFPMSKARMRDRQCRQDNLQVVVQKQIEIDVRACQRTSPPAAETNFDLGQNLKKCFGPNEVSNSGAPLRNEPCPGGPPTGSVSCQRLTRRVMLGV